MLEESDGTLHGSRRTTTLENVNLARTPTGSEEDGLEKGMTCIDAGMQSLQPQRGAGPTGQPCRRRCHRRASTARQSDENSDQRSCALTRLGQRLADGTFGDDVDSTER